MRRPLVTFRRSPLASLVVLAAIAACSGIITGPDAAPDTSPRTIRVTPTTLELTLGQSATLTAQLYDVTGAPTAPEAGRRIVFASANEAIATVTPEGLVTPVADGLVQVRAEYGVLGLGVPVRVLARPRLVLVDGDAQTAEQGDTLARRLVVRAFDANGQPVPDTAVTFAVTTGGGTVDPINARTDVTGAAQSLWTLGLALGAQTVRASAPGFDPVDLTATATAGTRAVRIGLTNTRSTLVRAGDTVSVVGVVYNVANAVLGSAVITWTSTDATAATVDAAGLVTAVAPGATYIRAVSGAARDSVRIDVQALPKLLLGGDNAHPAGLQDVRNVALPGAATAPVTITLRSADPSRLLLSTDAVTTGAATVSLGVGTGASTATYWIHGVEGASGTTARLIAEATGFAPDTVEIALERPAVAIDQLGPSTVDATGGEDPVLRVTVGASLSGGLFAPLAVRVGGVAPSFTLATTTPTTALLRHVATPFTVGGDQGPVASITFAMAAGREATSIGQVLGVPASLPLARTGTPGAASVSIVALPPEYTIAGTGSVSFTLTGIAVAPRIEIVSGDRQSVPWSQLAPDSLVVRLLDGNDLPVSGVAVDFTTTVNGGTLSPATAITDANGGAATQWRMSFVLGAHTVTASSAGFGDVTFQGTSLAGTVVTRVEVTAGRTTLDGGPGDIEQITFTAFNRADSIITSKPATWTSSDPAIVRVDSAGNVFALAVGQAFVSATVDAGSDSVLVTVPPNTVVTLGANAYTAAGMMREVVETFAAPAPVAFFLTLRSADPQRALVSASATDAGGAAFTVQVAAGATSFRWWLHGLEGMNDDTVSVIAERNGFTVDTVLATVVTPRVRVVSAGNLALQTTGGRDPWFGVTIGGAAQPVGAGFAFVELPVRTGGTPPTFVLSSSDPSVARLLFRSTANTSGAAQGPADAVTFSILPGFSGTFLPGYDSGELPSVEMSRPGGAGSAVIGVTGPAGYVLDGIAPTVTIAPAAPPAITLSLVGTPLLAVNGTATLRATLETPAPVGGSIVTLLSGDPARATVDAPSSITVAAGATTADFIITGVSAGSVRFTASASAYSDGTLDVGVTASAVSVPVTLNVPYTRTASLPITLPQAAPVGGTTVTVSSTDPSTVRVVDPTVFIAAGAISGNAQLEGLRLGQAVVSASSPGLATGNATVSVTAVLDIVESTLELNAGFSTASFSTRLLSAGTPFAAPVGGVPVSFVARNPACIAVPAGASVAAGQNSVVAVADYGGTAPLSCTTYVVATSPQFDPDSVQITVAAPPTSTLAVNPTIAAGLSRQGFYSLSVASPPGGTTVTITSSDAARLVVAPNNTTVGAGSIQLTIPSGFTQGTFWYSGIEGQAGATAQITVAIAGSVYAPPTPASVSVNPLGVELFGNTSLTTLAGDATGSVYLGELDPAGPTQSVRSEAVIRAGGQPVTITLTSSAPTVLLPVIGGVAASPGTVTILPGQSRATYGIRPVASGAGVITATSADAGSPTRANYPALITVTQPTSTLALNPVLAAGLSRQGFFSLQSAAPAGGVTVTVSSSDASRLVVAPNGTTAGTGSIQITVPAGFTQTSFWYSAIEGQDGTTSDITVAITGGLYAPPTPETVAVVPLGIELFGNTTLTTLGGDGTGSVYAGELTAAGPTQSVRNEAVVRAGGQPITITLTSSASGVLLPVVGGVAASPGTVTILPGQSRATYGIRPVAAGTGVITATSANAPSPTRANYPALITVTQPTSTLALNPSIAAGLSRQGFFSLQNAAPAGGVTVTVSSSDAARLVVSPNGTTAGTGSTQIIVPAGFTQATFWYSGIEGQGGTNAQVSVAVQGGLYADPAPIDVAIAPLGVEAFGTTSLITLGGDGTWSVFLGALGAAGPSQSVGGEAVIRAGGPSVTVTLTSTAPSVALPVVAGVAASPRTVNIVPGQSRTSFDVRPLAAGTTTITATSTTAASPARTNYPSTITVTSPTMSLSVAPRIGAGLSAQGFLSLQVPAPAGGVTVRITSSDPTRLLLAPNAATAGTAFIDAIVPAGFTQTTFWVSGVEDVTGNPTITAQAPGFTDATVAVAIEPVGVTWFGATTLSASGADGSGTVYVGVVNGVAGNRTISPEQPIRFGGVARTITITSSDPSVVLPVVGGIAQQGITVTIQPGQSRANVEVRPIGAGTATIAPTGAGLLPAQSATLPQTVVVTAPLTGRARSP